MGKAEWQEVFSVIDEDTKGAIPTAKFALAVRAAGGYPTGEQVKTMIEKADPKGSGKVTLDAFIEQMEWINRVNPLDLDTIKESFKVFDKDDNGCISKAELTHVLCSMGDKLTTEEADEFAKEAYLTKDGLIEYVSFLKQVTEG
eukprot:Nitzschia sp. Nitz4//scaffold290_size23356//2353//2784//NITZ4_008485-RA/size23356-processed-gene-0.39-mRNA-1//1//CDS//3329546084//7744//frame0